MKKVLFILLFVGCYFAAFSQTALYQTIRGRVIDLQTEETLIGASVLISTISPVMGTITDADGEFKIENIPIGRHDLEVSFIGYKPVAMKNIMLSSGKEVVLEIKMEEQVVELSEISVKAYHKDQALNEFATVSARSFTIEETERYAGSLGDPSRMASNFAGVMSVSDQRNDIIIRGNSPAGLLWRIEGIDVPNPNHFGSMGSTGGPVSMLNNNLLTNSDFFTGAFPAEFGNALSGAFDLNMRNGNNQKYEFLGQIGFNGFELGAEGPFSKDSKSSFIANFRYSTLEVFSKLGMSFGTGSAVPQYKDFTFKINLPTKKYGKFTFFGIAGISFIAMLDSKADSANYGFGGTDLYYGSNMGVTGVSHTYFFKNNSKLTTKIATSTFNTLTKLDSIKKDGKDSIWRFYDSDFIEYKHSFYADFNKKFNSKNYFAIGGILDYFQFDYLDSVNTGEKYIRQFDIKGDQILARAYLNWQHKFNDKLTLNTGLHYLHLISNNTTSIEPRIGLRWNLTNNQSLNCGFGMHSQTQTMALYYYKNPDNNQFIYKDLDLNKSMHYVLSYDNVLAKDFRLKMEAYYQYLYNIPASKSDIPQMSMLNTGDSFTLNATADMQNIGTGENYGVELTLEKFFSNGYYFLTTTSLYESKYTDQENVIRNSQFAGNYVFNALAGYEFNVGKQSLLCFDIKTVYAGGKRFIPIDIEASKSVNQTVYDWKHAYEDKMDDYFRVNARITFKTNNKHLSQEWGLDLQNLTNHKNIFQTYWNATKQEIQTDYQQGFMPMMTWRIVF